MRKLYACLMALLLLSLVTTPAASQASTPQPNQQASEIASRVDKRYNGLSTLTTDFTEIYSGNGVSRSETGTLVLKRPGKMRWDYRKPSEKLFVSDGKNAIFYVPGERQARKTEVKKLDDLRSPLRYLLGKTKLQKEFDNLSIANAVTPKASGNVVLSGVPKNMADRVRQVLFEITPKAQIERIVIEEIDGAVTEFQFSNMVENLSIPDRQFRFTAPAGVEIIEATELAGN